MSNLDRLISIPLARGLTVGVCAVLFACASRPTVELPELASLRASLPLAHAQAEHGEGPPEWVNQAREDDAWVYGLGIVPVSRSSYESLYRALGDARDQVLGHLHDEGAMAASPGRLGPDLGLEDDEIEYEAIYFDERARTWYVLARLDREAAADSIARAIEALDARAVVDTRELEEGDESVTRALRLLFTLDRRAQLASQLYALGGEVPERPTDRGNITGTMRAHEALSRHPFRIEVSAPVPELREDVRAALGEFAIETAEFGSVENHWVSVRLSEHGDWSRRERYLSVEGSVEVALGDGTVRNIPIRAVGTGHSADEARDRAARVARDEVVKAVRTALVETGRMGSVSALR